VLPRRWQLEDVDDVEGLIAFVVERYLGRRGAYLRPELREDLDDYLLTRTWELYRRFDPSKASTSLTLSTYLSRRLTYACTDWYRRTFGDSRYKDPDDELPLVLDTIVGTEFEVTREDAVSLLPSLTDTGRDRWQRFGLLHAAGFDYGEIAARTGVATGEIGTELEALRHELRSLS
jgi:DNA-directed RNA polymerase specialized sigma24 family protein